MAHEILNNFSDPVLSSSLRRIDIAADGQFADVQLATADGKVLLAERYYAFNDMIFVFDLASLIEAEMRTSGQSYAEFRFDVFTDDPQNKWDGALLRVLYCDRLALGPDVSHFLSENFLTAIPTRRLPVSAALSLPFFANREESIATFIECRSRHIPSALVFTHHFHHDATAVASATGIYTASVDFSEIIADAACVFDCPASEIEPLTFTVSVGQRSVTCYFDRSLRMENTFNFRNCFNAVDSICLPCLTTAKTDVERSTAIINGESRIYNQSAAKSYEVEAGPLTAAEAEAIDQLLTSHHVEHAAQQILITDQTCEISNADDKLNSVKFTWRYANNRPVVGMSTSPNIFSQQFSPKFS